jgi:cysteine synthase A
LRLERLAPASGAVLYAKLELMNPGGSHKDRAALAVLRAASQSGRLPLGGEVVTASAGNFGTSLALIGARLGFRVVVVAPRDFRAVRKETLRAFGVTLRLTDPSLGMPGAEAEAERYAHETGALRIDARGEDAARAYEELGAEIVESLSEYAPSLVVAGLGSGSTLRGLAQALAARAPACALVGVGARGGETIEGLRNEEMHTALSAETPVSLRWVSSEEANAGVARLARAGVLAGPSAGAALVAAEEAAERLPAGSRVVLVACDSGERYFAPRAAQA